MNKTTEITIDGTTYIVDLDSAIKSGLIKEKRQIRTGQFYLYHQRGADQYNCIYILANLLYENGKFNVALVGLQSGNRWSGIVGVQNEQNITAEEWDRITNGCTQFSPVTVKFKIVEE